MAGAEFGSSWPKVSVSCSFWVDKMCINAYGTNTELLWSPISSFIIILVEITDPSLATSSVSESFIIFSMSPSSLLSTESSNAELSLLDNLLISTYFFHTKRLNVSLCKNFLFFFPHNFPSYHVHIQYHSKKCFQFSQ